MMTLTVKITARTAAGIEESLHDVMLDIENGFVNGRFGDDTEGGESISFAVLGRDESDAAETAGP
jgi:hypothetical protein